MAIVKLSRSECSRDMLPNVCMRCGAPADVTKFKTFSWFPPIAYIGLIAGLLPFAIIALVLTKRMAVSVPLCREHRGHWSSRTLVVVLALLPLVVFGIGIVLWGVNQPPGNDDTMGLLCAGWAVLLLAWLVVAIVVQLGAIRATEITDRSVKLTGVDEEFVAALEEERDRDRDDRRYRRRQYDDIRDDYDDEYDDDADEPPRRRRRPRDD